MIYTVNYYDNKVGLFRNNLLIEEENLLIQDISPILHDFFIGNLAAVQACLLAYKHKVNVFSMKGWNTNLSYYLEQCFGKSFSLKFTHINKKAEFWLEEIKKIKTNIFSNINLYKKNFQQSQKEIEKFIIFLFAGIEKINIQNPEAIQVLQESIKTNINILQYNEGKTLKEQLSDYNLFTDASIKHHEQASRIANVMYNREHMELTNYHKRLDYKLYNDINKAEIYSIIQGLKVAKSMEIKKLRIFTDSLCAIEKLEAYNPYYKNDYSSLIASLIEQTQNYIKCEFVHILRKHNTIADSLTKF